MYRKIRCDSYCSTFLEFRVETKHALTEALVPRICSRCLTAGHAREACKSPIKCFSCLCGGHVAFNCPGDSNWKGKDKKLNSNGKGAAVDLNEKQIIERPKSIVLGTDLVTRPRHPSPLVFSSFRAWARSQASTS